jgi:hypothetical protein
MERNDTAAEVHRLELGIASAAAQDGTQLARVYPPTLSNGLSVLVISVCYKRNLTT